MYRYRLLLVTLVLCAWMLGAKAVLPTNLVQFAPKSNLLIAGPLQAKKDNNCVTGTTLEGKVAWSLCGLNEQHSNYNQMQVIQNPANGYPDLIYLAEQEDYSSTLMAITSDSGNKIWEYNFHSATFAMSSDGKYVLLLADNSNIQILDGKSGQLLGNQTLPDLNDFVMGTNHIMYADPAETVIYVAQFQDGKIDTPLSSSVNVADIIRFGVTDDGTSVIGDSTVTIGINLFTHVQWRERDDACWQLVVQGNNFFAVQSPDLMKWWIRVGTSDGNYTDYAITDSASVVVDSLFVDWSGSYQAVGVSVEQNDEVWVYGPSGLIHKEPTSNGYGQTALYYYDNHLYLAYPCADEDTPCLKDITSSIVSQ